MTKTINRNTGKYRNLRQNNVFGSIFIQNVQIWAKFHEFGPFDRVLLKPLLIFCCILSGWAQKWQRQSTQTLASIEIQSKTTFWLNFHTKRQNLSQMSPNSTVSASFLWTFGHFLLYPIRLSKKMPKDFKIFTDKYRNLRQNNGIA